MNTLAQRLSSPVRANFLNGIKEKKIWIILLLVNIFAAPYALIMIAFFNQQTLFGLALSVLAMVVNMLFAIVIPFLRFDYCYDKMKVDMAYSLPLTRKQKFLSDYFSGLVLYLGPYLVQIILSYLVTALIVLIKPEMHFQYAYYSARLDMLGDIWLWSRVTKVLVIILLTQIMLYTVTSLVIACTGTIFEAVSATVYFNILMISTIYVVYLLCAHQLFGMDLSDNFLNAAYVCSPLGGFTYLLHYCRGKSPEKIWYFVYLIGIVIYFVLTYIIMTKRKAEDVGKTFVVKIFYPIMLVAVMLHFAVIAFYTGNSIINMILFTFVCYVIIEMIANRGVKRMKQSLLRYTGMVVCVLAVVIVVNKTNCFGIAYHVADAKDVSEITISYHGIFYDYQCTDIKITDPESIQTILEVQEDIIKEYKNESKELGIWNIFKSQESPYFYNGEEFVLETNERTFKGPFEMTVSGEHESYYRDYDISYQELRKLLSVELSDEYIEAKIAIYKKYTNSLVVCDAFGVNQKTLVQYTGGEPSEIIDQFFEALETDLKNVSEEEYLHPSETTTCYVSLDRGEINILPSYTNTLAFLEEYQAIPTLSDEDYKNIIKNQEISVIDKNWSENGEDLAASGYYSTLPSYIISINDITVETDDTEELEQLLRVAQIQYVSEEPCYIINIYGENYVIPSEYSEIAQKVLGDQ